MPHLSSSVSPGSTTPLRADRAWSHPATAYVPGKDGKDSRHPLAEGRAPANDGEIAVDSGTATAGRFRIGDTITLATDGPVMTKRLVGTVTTDDTRVTAGGTLVLFDTATAQKPFPTPGHSTGIDLTAAAGTTAYGLADRVTAVLPADRAEATTGPAQAAQQAILVDTLPRGYEKAPMVFAGVPLFIGSFLIVNTFTMLVKRRSRETALLRAIGASRRQVSRSVLLEALVVGLAASVAGFLLGLGIAAVLPGALGGDGTALPSGPLVIGPRSVVATLGVGVGVTEMGHAGKFTAYRIVGVYQDNAVAHDALGSRAEVAASSFLPDSVQRVLLRTDGPATTAPESRLRTAVGNNPLLKVQDREQLVREAAGTMGDLLDVMYGMLGIGVVISALGIVNTMDEIGRAEWFAIGVLGMTLAGAAHAAIGGDPRRADVRPALRGSASPRGSPRRCHGSGGPHQVEGAATV